MLLIFQLLNLFNCKSHKHKNYYNLIKRNKSNKAHLAIEKLNTNKYNGIDQKNFLIKNQYSNTTNSSLSEESKNTFKTKIPKKHDCHSIINKFNQIQSEELQVLKNIETLLKENNNKLDIILNINNKEGQSNLSSINNLNNNVKLVENTMTNNT